MGGVNWAAHQTCLLWLSACYVWQSSDQYWSWSEASSSASFSPASRVADAIAATVSCSSGWETITGAGRETAARCAVAPFAHLCRGPLFLMSASMYLQYRETECLAISAADAAAAGCRSVYPIMQHKACI